MNLLIVRLGALGDIVHAIPAAAALRAAMPAARIDWLVDAKHRSIVDLVTAVDRVVPLEGRTIRAWADVVRRARQAQYDVAFDFQGLMKSAVLARASGAARVAGFSIWHLREKSARPFYSETDNASADDGGHVIRKNLHLLSIVGVETSRVEFPIADVPSAALDEVRRDVGTGPFALLNPGAAWPNKRWPPGRRRGSARWRRFFATSGVCRRSCCGAPASRGSLKRSSSARTARRSVLRRLR
jgi:heptosyltransferase I